LQKGQFAVEYFLLTNNIIKKSFNTYIEISVSSFITKIT